MKAAAKRVSRAICLLAMLAWSVSAHAFTMTRTPTSCSDVTGIGTQAWTGTGNVGASDNSYATVSLSDNRTSHYLECTGYNFAVPDGAVINGITVSIERHSSSTITYDADVQLVKAGVIGGTDQSTGTEYPTSDTVATYGSSSDLWGTTWAASDIRNANFGVAFAAQKIGSSGGSRTASVDVIQITIDYSIPSMSCTQPSNTPAGLTLSCVCDNFGRSSLNPSTIYGSNWTTSTSDLTGIVPSVVNPGYLRLTDNTGNNAKAVTVPGIFPASGNYISVEFQEFAYNGSGADGIAVTLSDYSVSPVPGAFGGSLGYAQKTGTSCTSSGATTCPGFAGGWVGVALDEYGNYQNPTEGRIGGPGAVSESVGVRGSGSGVNNYNWIAGTSSLTTKIDAPSSGTPSPGYYYQVIVDARTPTAASVAVNRDTGSGYSSLISIPNIFTAATAQGFTQNVVPDNWQISFTGSTGGFANIHEISGLKICAQTVAPPTGGTASGFATIDEAYGTPPSVAVQNYLTGHIYTKLVGTPFKLDVAAVNNSQILTTYAASSSKSVTVKLVDNTDGACVLDSSQANYCSSTCTSKSAVSAGTGGTSSQTLTFASGATDKGQKQTTNFLLNTAYRNLVAIVTDGSTSACSTDAFSVRPTAVASVTSTNATNTGTTGSPTFKAASDNFNLTATVGGVSGVANGYTGTLKIDKNAMTVKQPTSGGTLGTLSASAFSAATSGTTTATASTNFTYSEVGAFNFIACTDTSNPDTCSRGVYDGVNYLECGSTSSSACDSYKPSTWTYVDSISSKKDCVFGSYSNIKDASGKYGCNFGITADTSTFGRFIPARFSMYSNGFTKRSDIAGCSASTFTYMGEPFGASFVISAYNGAGSITKNYQGSLAKLSPATAADWLNYGSANTMGLWMIATGYPVTGGTCKAVFSGTSSDPANSGSNNTRFASCSAGATAPATITRAAGKRVAINGTPSTPTWSNGVATFTADLKLERADAPDGPYDTLNVGIAPQDSDGVTLAPALDVDADNTGSFERGTIGSTVLRYGALQINNIYGSELLNAPVSVTARYWNNLASLYMTNADDNCTAISSGSVSFSNPLKGITSTAGFSVLTGAALSGGSGTLLVSKPSPTPTIAGSVDLSSSITYLPGTGRVAFGLYNKGAPVIYLRELY